MDAYLSGQWNNPLLSYGQFLGNRYKDSPNVIWNMGNDFQNWGNPANDAVILAIADGIKSVDTNLMTIELNYSVSESQDDPNWISRITVNGVYTYYPTYDETLVAYNKPNIMPVLFLEEHYEFEERRRGVGDAECSAPSGILVADRRRIGRAHVRQRLRLAIQSRLAVAPGFSGSDATGLFQGFFP